MLLSGFYGLCVELQMTSNLSDRVVDMGALESACGSDKHLVLRWFEVHSFKNYVVCSRLYFERD